MPELPAELTSRMPFRAIMEADRLANDVWPSSSHWRYDWYRWSYSLYPSDEFTRSHPTLSANSAAMVQ